MTAATAEPVLPNYAGGCIANVGPALLEPGRPAAWLPAPVRDAPQIVLFVLDGVGWLQLQARPHVAPTLCGMAGGPITSVVPSTTASALTSITVGASPAEHGVIGYRVHVGDGAILEVLKWQTPAGDARGAFPPESLRRGRPFAGRPVPIVTRAEFAGGGFTGALAADSPFVGWRVPSTIPVEVGRLLREDAPLVYAYYDGVDKVAHAHGFGAHFDAELAFTDRLVADVAAQLPPGAALLVTSDHGQVHVGDAMVTIDEALLADVAFTTGEGRFTWLHARPGREAAVVAAARSYEQRGIAWVRTPQEAAADGWFGDPTLALRNEVLARLGAVVLAAAQPVAFTTRTDASPSLVCRHGSLTADEMLVPLLASRA